MHSIIIRNSPSGNRLSSIQYNNRNHFNVPFFCSLPPEAQSAYFKSLINTFNCYNFYLHFYRILSIVSRSKQSIASITFLAIHM